MSISKGSVTWKSPSNIALIKYWGKKDFQIPRNPSISLTLSEAYTTTCIDFSANSSAEDIEVSFLFEGKPNEQFSSRIQKFLAGLPSDFDFLKTLKLTITSSNSFPHSSGIASSASAMSALSLCLCSIKELFDPFKSRAAFLQYASDIARQASGSASRSVFPTLAVWGSHHDYPGSSDLHGMAFTEAHAVFQKFCDSILIVDKSPKSVSSSIGHQLMENNPFSKQRFEQANRNMTLIKPALIEGDLDTFIKIVEEEALSLHAMMMVSKPSFILMKPKTLHIIEAIKAFRQKTRLPLCFTLDAGPNVHLLYPDEIKEEVLAFIERDLITYCEEQHVIHDHVGRGPIKIEA